MMNEPVGNGSGDGCGIEYLSPVSKGRVRCNEGGTFLMSCADDLEEQMRAPVS